MPMRQKIAYETINFITVALSDNAAHCTALFPVKLDKLNSQFIFRSCMRVSGHSSDFKLS